MSAAPLGPGTTIGIVGGGQLGRMLAQAARQHGYGVADFGEPRCRRRADLLGRAFRCYQLGKLRLDVLQALQ